MTRPDSASASADISPHIRIDELTPSPVPILRVTPDNARTDAALLHFHGGGYRQGSPAIFSESVGRIAAACRTQTFSVGYRLSGVSPFPAAVDDAVAAYRRVSEQVGPDRVVLWGDSAGGGLAAALLLRLRQLGITGPAGAMLFSPWLDLRNLAASFNENCDSDAIFSLDKANEAAGAYLAGQEATDPLVSPVLGDWAGQPRLVLQVSGSEVLRDDSLALARTAIAAGVDVRLKVHEGEPHIWNLAYPLTPASQLAVAYMSEQLDEILGKLV